MMKYLNRGILCFLSLILVVGLAACGKRGAKEDGDGQDESEYLSGLYYAVIDVNDYGKITLQLNADAAPATVTNFVNLIEDGFYDGLTFHRIIDGFMIQGGNPDGTGLGGSGQTIRGEFASNGFENPISHVRGTISMARSNAYDSASSQFFIVQSDSTYLDGNYAAFGTVLAGMSVVDEICQTTPVLDENGSVSQENQPGILSIYLTDEATALEAQKNDQPKIQPTATILFDYILSADGTNPVGKWNINENSEQFLLSSTEDLLAVSLYRIDLENGFEYDDTDLLAFYGNLGAYEQILVRLLVPEGLPNAILVAEEHSGAVARYLISYDGLNGGAYLVPVLD